MTPSREARTLAAQGRSELERLKRPKVRKGEDFMSDYVFAYYGEPKFESPEEGAKHMAKWQAWMGGLGDAIVNPGHPMGKPKTVSSGGVSDDAGSNRLTGFSIVKADSMDAAVEMAKGCPHLEHGTIDVAEAMTMTM